MLINLKDLDILEYSRGELVGKNWFDTCIPKEIVSDIKKVFNQLIQGA